MLQGGKSGPAILLSNPDDSLLIQAVSYTHSRLKMPPTGKLKEEEIADLRNSEYGEADEEHTSEEDSDTGDR